MKKRASPSGRDALVVPPEFAVRSRHTASAGPMTQLGNGSKPVSLTRLKPFYPRLRRGCWRGRYRLPAWGDSLETAWSPACLHLSLCIL